MNAFLKIVSFGFLAGVCFAQPANPAGAPAQPAAPAVPGLTVTTPAFADGAEIPEKYTQAAPMAVSPKLEWTYVPAGTVSFVLLMHDLDVSIMRTTEDNLHWLIWNIPGAARGLPENVAAGTLADGTMQVVGRGGVAQYRGPGAPAVGPQHHYIFELYALDAKLDLPASATRAEVMKAVDGHVIGKGAYAGRFKRPAVAAAPAVK